MTFFLFAIKKIAQFHLIFFLLKNISVLLLMLSSNEEVILTSDESSLDQEEHSLIENERINILKNLQISYNQLESTYYKSVYELEYKFHEQCSYLFEQRSDIINGKYEPNDDECQLKTNFIERPIASSNSIGIPSFWLQTFKQVKIF